MIAIFPSEALISSSSSSSSSSSTLTSLAKDNHSRTKKVNAEMTQGKGEHIKKYKIIHGKGKGKGKGHNSQLTTSKSPKSRKERREPPRNAPVVYYNEGVIARDMGDLDNAKLLFQLAVDKGHSKAMYNLGLLSSEYPEDAFLHFREAAFKGIAEAQYKLSTMLLERNEVGDKKEHLNYLKKAANQGHAKANFELGLHYERTGLPPEHGINIELAKKHYKVAAMKQFIPAYVNLGRMLELSSSLEDQIESYEWYEMACHDHNDKIAAFNLSMLYTFNIGNKSSHHKNNHSLKSTTTINEHISDDDKDSTNDLVCSSDDDISNQTWKHQKAIHYLVLAADRGHGKACFNYARRLMFGGGLSTFEQGGGVNYDLIKAIHYLHKGSENGDMKSKRLLKFIERKEKEETYDKYYNHLQYEDLIRKQFNDLSSSSSSQHPYHTNVHKVMVADAGSDLSMSVHAKAEEEEREIKLEIARIERDNQARRLRMQADVSDDEEDVPF